PPASLGAADTPTNLASFAARLLHPFIHVWPAVALLGDSPLGRLVADWPRSLLAMFEGASPESLGSEGSALAGSTATQASSSSSQPPWSWLTSDSIPPLNWIGSDGALSLFVFLLILAAATAAIVVAIRRELGAPWLPRRRNQGH
ncbi:MAG TPA: hypothetical protein VGG40_00990, partial [Solirubrobacterales bacterium]